MDTRALRDVAFSEFKLLLSRINKKSAARPLVFLQLPLDRKFLKHSQKHFVKSCASKAESTELGQVAFYMNACFKRNCSKHS